METNIREEALEAIERMKHCAGQDVLIDQNFNIPIFNIIWRIATNNRYNVSFIDIVWLQTFSPRKNQSFQHDDPFISNQIKELSQVFLNAPSIAFMPWARFVMPSLIGFTQVDNFYKNIKALFHGIISEHEREYEHESPPKVCST